MSLNDIVSVTISRSTTAVTQRGFGIHAIISEFATNKTTTTFARHRFYASLTEMSTDGWSSTDAEYKMATAIFSQNPKVDQIMIGRKDSGDATWADALDAIRASNDDWYSVSIISSRAATLVFDSDFVTSNAIDVTINGVVVTTVNFTTDHLTTMQALKTQIEADIAGSTATIDSADVTNRTLIVEVFGSEGVTAATAVVTGGASQPTAVITYVKADDYKAVAAWIETQKKIYFYASSSADIKDSVITNDIASFMKTSAYDRTISIYHPNAQGDASPQFPEGGWPGESLPYKPGEQTWAFKTLSGVTSYELTTSERNAILGKNCNIYTQVGGVNITEEGKVASGEYIDTIRGIDKLEARLQEEIFSNLVNTRKIPFTDEGITLVAGVVEGVLQEMSRDGFLVAESIVVTAPKAADVSTTDKTNRLLPDVTFIATLQGAIHKINITGVVSV